MKNKLLTLFLRFVILIKRILSNKKIGVVSLG